MKDDYCCNQNCNQGRDCSKRKDMKILQEAKKLADDIAEYAPSTNIELMIRDLIKEIERLQSEKINAVKSKAKIKAS